MIAWIFPGQGSQFVGMAGRLSSEPATQIFTEAARVLGWDVRAVSNDATALSRTEYVQPAVFTVSIAAARTLEARGVLPNMVAGHSLGELSALVAAHSLSFEDGLRAVAARGEAMARAARHRAGGMAAVLGLDLAAVQDLCARSGNVVVANINAPGQTVISGDDDGLAKAAARARDAGGRVRRLDVAVAAHSPLMVPAQKAFRESLDHVTWLSPLVPVVDGLSGRIHQTAVGAPERLVQALVSPVRWTHAVRALADAGATTFVEVGPGDVLAGLVRRIDPSVTVHAAGSDAAIAELRLSREGVAR